MPCKFISFLIHTILTLMWIFCPCKENQPWSYLCLVFGVHTSNITVSNMHWRHLIFFLSFFFFSSGCQPMHSSFSSSLLGPFIWLFCTWTKIRYSIIWFLIFHHFQPIADNMTILKHYLSGAAMKGKEIGYLSQYLTWFDIPQPSQLSQLPAACE